jgi:hypothetical protein
MTVGSVRSSSSRHDGDQQRPVTSTYDEVKRNIAGTKADDLAILIMQTSAEAASTFFEPRELILLMGATCLSLSHKT